MERMSAAEFKRLHGGGIVTTGQKPQKPQIRMPAPVKMNKTEASWMEQLKRKYPSAIIQYEPITFRLPSGTRYTPDFMVLWQQPMDSVRLEFWEVKGPHIHNPRSIHAFKEAASAFPMFSFKFAQKSKDGWLTT